MTAYVIQGDKVIAHAKIPAPLPEGAIAIRSLRDLEARDLPSSRLVAIWNMLPGHKPIAKFKSRDVALRRLWAAIEQLAHRGPAKTPKEKAGNTTRSGSKQARLVELLRRPKGATIEELAAATDWQQHSVRGALSGALKKRLGFKINSSKEERGRVYRILGPNAASRA